MTTKTLILGSTSPYRRELLERLGISFETRKPLIDEEAEKDPSLSPEELARHLAFKKAESLLTPGCVIIGGDQLVSFEGQILGKPGHREKAIEQLLAMNGKAHDLLTAICVLDGNQILHHLDSTRIHFKKLERSQIEKVVDLDEPFDCAGAYKIEKHGIALVEKIESEDFTAIQGLPLLALSRMLKACSLDTP
ncbi:MAG: septum formation protein Maf [Bdellovibrionaceae bacterium]|nr:septum formation protein Maf [Pseudobdellovibrionaceae bacterium]